ncbi:MAG: hypothetical protein QGI45_16570, partial [Myxococcota bacterium]|nr:hypothetical protein [Myxococcota bacterium]
MRTRNLSWLCLLAFGFILGLQGCSSCERVSKKTSCNVDSDCTLPEICLEGQCATLSCNNDSDCRGAWTCQSGF